MKFHRRVDSTTPVVRNVCRVAFMCCVVSLTLTSLKSHELAAQRWAVAVTAYAQPAPNSSSSTNVTGSDAWVSTSSPIALLPACFAAYGVHMAAANNGTARRVTIVKSDADGAGDASSTVAGCAATVGCPADANLVLTYMVMALPSGATASLRLGSEWYAETQLLALLATDVDAFGYRQIAADADGPRQLFLNRNTIDLELLTTSNVGPIKGFEFGFECTAGDDGVATEAWVGCPSRTGNASLKGATLRLASLNATHSTVGSFSPLYFDSAISPPSEVSGLPQSLPCRLSIVCPDPTNQWLFVQHSPNVVSWYPGLWWRWTYNVSTSSGTTRSMTSTTTPIQNSPARRPWAFAPSGGALLEYYPLTPQTQQWNLHTYALVQCRPKPSPLARFPDVPPTTDAGSPLAPAPCSLAADAVVGVASAGGSPIPSSTADGRLLFTAASACYQSDPDGALDDMGTVLGPNITIDCSEHPAGLTMVNFTHWMHACQRHTFSIRFGSDPNATAIPLPTSPIDGRNTAYFGPFTLPSGLTNISVVHIDASSTTAAVNSPSYGQARSDIADAAQCSGLSFSYQCVAPLPYPPPTFDPTRLLSMGMASPSDMQKGAPLLVPITRLVASEIPSSAPPNATSRFSHALTWFSASPSPFVYRIDLPVAPALFRIQCRPDEQVVFDNLASTGGLVNVTLSGFGPSAPDSVPPQSSTLLTGDGSWPGWPRYTFVPQPVSTSASIVTIAFFAISIPFNLVNTVNWFGSGYCVERASPVLGSGEVAQAMTRLNNPNDTAAFVQIGCNAVPMAFVVDPTGNRGPRRVEIRTDVDGAGPLSVPISTPCSWALSCANSSDRLQLDAYSGGLALGMINATFVDAITGKLVSLPLSSYFTGELQSWSAVNGTPLNTNSTRIDLWWGYAYSDPIGAAMSWSCVAADSFEPTIRGCTNGAVISATRGAIVTDLDGAGPFPVANALSPAQGCDWTVTCPTPATALHLLPGTAFGDNGRDTFRMVLFNRSIDADGSEESAKQYRIPTAIVGTVDPTQGVVLPFRSVTVQIKIGGSGFQLFYACVPVNTSELLGNWTQVGCSTDGTPASLPYGTTRGRVWTDLDGPGPIALGWQYGADPPCGCAIRCAEGSAVVLVPSARIAGGDIGLGLQAPFSNAVGSVETSAWARWNARVREPFAFNSSNLTVWFFSIMVSLWDVPISHYAGVDGVFECVPLVNVSKENVSRVVVPSSVVLDPHAPTLFLKERLAASPLSTANASSRLLLPTLRGCGVPPNGTILLSGRMEGSVETDADGADVVQLNLDPQYLTTKSSTDLAPSFMSCSVRIQCPNPSDQIVQLTDFFTGDGTNIGAMFWLRPTVTVTAPFLLLRETNMSASMCPFCAWSVNATRVTLPSGDVSILTNPTAGYSLRYRCVAATAYELPNGPQGGRGQGQLRRPILPASPAIFGYYAPSANPIDPWGVSAGTEVGALFAGNWLSDLDGIGPIVPTAVGMTPSRVDRVFPPSTLTVRCPLAAASMDIDLRNSSLRDTSAKLHVGMRIWLRSSLGIGLPVADAPTTYFGVQWSTSIFYSLNPFFSDDNVSDLAASAWRSPNAIGMNDQAPTFQGPVTANAVPPMLSILVPATSVTLAHMYFDGGPFGSTSSQQNWGAEFAFECLDAVALASSLRESFDAATLSADLGNSTTAAAVLRAFGVTNASTNATTPPHAIRTNTPLMGALIPVTTCAAAPNDTVFMPGALFGFISTDFDGAGFVQSVSSPRDPNNLDSLAGNCDWEATCPRHMRVAVVLRKWDPLMSVLLRNYATESFLNNQSDLRVPNDYVPSQRSALNAGLASLLVTSIGNVQTTPVSVRVPFHNVSLTIVNIPTFVPTLVFRKATTFSGVNWAFECVAPSSLLQTLVAPTVGNPNAAVSVMTLPLRGALLSSSQLLGQPIATTVVGVAASTYSRWATAEMFRVACPPLGRGGLPLALRFRLNGTSLAGLPWFNATGNSTRRQYVNASVVPQWRASPAETLSVELAPTTVLASDQPLIITSPARTLMWSMTFECGCNPDRNTLPYPDHTAMPTHGLEELQLPEACFDCGISDSVLATLPECGCDGSVHCSGNGVAVQIGRGCACNCSLGWAGLRCEYCADGFDPTFMCAVPLRMVPIATPTTSKSRSAPSRSASRTVSRSGSRPPQPLTSGPATAIDATAPLDTTTPMNATAIVVSTTPPRPTAPANPGSNNHSSSAPSHQWQRAITRTLSRSRPLAVVGGQLSLAAAPSGTLTAAGTAFVGTATAVSGLSAFVADTSAVAGVSEMQTVSLVARLSCARATLSQVGRASSFATFPVLFGPPDQAAIVGLSTLLSLVAGVHAAVYAIVLAATASDSSLRDRVRWPSFSVVAFALFRPALLTALVERVIALPTARNAGVDVACVLWAGAIQAAFPVGYWYVHVRRGRSGDGGGVASRHDEHETPVEQPDADETRPSKRDAEERSAATLLGGRLAFFYFPNEATKTLPPWRRLVVPTGRWLPSGLTQRFGAWTSPYLPRRSQAFFLQPLRDLVVAVCVQPQLIGNSIVACHWASIVVAIVTVVAPAASLLSRAPRSRSLAALSLFVACVSALLTLIGTQSQSSGIGESATAALSIVLAASSTAAVAFTVLVTVAEKRFYKALPVQFKDKFAESWGEHEQEGHALTTGLLSHVPDVATGNDDPAPVTSENMSTSRGIPCDTAEEGGEKTPNGSLGRNRSQNSNDTTITKAITASPSPSFNERRFMTNPLLGR